MSLASSTSRRSVGISELIISDVAEDVIITYSLGSCIGVTVYDPQSCIGGLVHCMLPTSKLDEEKAKRTPGMFADTGVVALLQGVMDLGADKSSLVIKVAGAGAPMDTSGRFKIGERNVTMLRKVLWKNSLMLAAEDIGGTEPRTMWLELATGRTVVRKSGQEVEL